MAYWYVRSFNQEKIIKEEYTKAESFDVLVLRERQSGWQVITATKISAKEYSNKFKIHRKCTKEKKIVAFEKRPHIDNPIMNLLNNLLLRNRDRQ